MATYSVTRVRPPAIYWQAEAVADEITADVKAITAEIAAISRRSILKIEVRLHQARQRFHYVRAEGGFTG